MPVQLAKRTVRRARRGAIGVARTFTWGQTKTDIARWEARNRLAAFQKKQGRATDFSTRNPKDAWVGSQRKMMRANERAAEAERPVRKYEAKLAKIDANLQRAEASWPIIKQVRRWFWNWRKKRVGKRLGKKSEKLAKLQSYQAGLKTSFETVWDTKLARKKAPADIEKTQLDLYLNVVGREIDRMKKIMDFKVQLLEAQNQPLPTHGGRKISATLFTNLKNAINTAAGLPDKRTAAYRLLEAERVFENVNQLFLSERGRKLTRTNARFGELLDPVNGAFASTPP